MGADESDGWYYYASDGAEALREIEESILSLEGETRDPSTINRLYRALHTLKGNSAVMGLPVIEHFAHAAEDMVGLVRDGGVAIDRPFVDRMLEVVDVLTLTVERAGREHRDAEEGEVDAITRELKAWYSAHRGKRSEQVPGAVRGDILIFTSTPAEPDPGLQDTSVDLASLEVSLSFVEERLVPLAAGFSALSTEPGDDALATLADELGALAEVLARTGFDAARTDLVRAAHNLRARADLDGAGKLAIATLIGLEDRYVAAAPSPRAFGVRAALAEAAPALLPSAASEEAAELLFDMVIEASVPPPASLPPPAPVAELTAKDHKKESPTGKRPSKPDDAARADVLRIDARKVSGIMDLAGEIGLACGAVVHHPELTGLELLGFAAATHKLEMLIRELQNEVSGMRLVPVEGVFQRMHRVVRDTAKRTGKKVELVLVGEDTEIDKVLVDALHDPLVHVLRNAIDHGIELPEVRRALGKPETGRIVLSATHQGGEVAIAIRDDGKGLATQTILAKAKERGLVPEGATPSNEEIFRYVFLPGFSTKQKIDELSGRGVGMDVLKTTIESFRGRVELKSAEGKGSTISMMLPLTLAFVEAMVVRDEDQLYALPIERVREVFVVSSAQITVNAAAEGQVVIRLRDEFVPVLWLREFYRTSPVMPELSGRVVVVVQTSRGSIALPIDALLGNQQVMLKPLKGLLANVRAGAGCGMLRSGDVALALDCERLYA